MKINGTDFSELESEKYWSFPKSYKGDAKIETREMIVSGAYIGARKIDGAYYRFIKDDKGNMCLQGRSKSVKGYYLDKIDWVPHLKEWFEELPNGTCLLGEIFFRGNEGSNKVTTIMGCLQDKAIKRQQEGDKLSYYVFDVWAWGGKSLMNEPVEKRVEYIKKLPKHKYVKRAVYREGYELFDYLEKVLTNGGEGIVITKKGTTPSPGKRTARKTLKVKKEIQQNIDVIVTGALRPTREYTGKYVEEWKYWYNTLSGEKTTDNKFFEMCQGTPWIPVTKNFYYDWAGSLIVSVMKDEVRYEVGTISGLSEEVLSNWRFYLEKVMEVSAMELTKDKKLRHPRFVKWREDKTPKDCEWSQFE